MNIVVVESPAKAKTINKYLGPGYEVLASFGHIRDLPAKDGSVDPDRQLQDDLGSRRTRPEAHQRHRPCRQIGRQTDPRHRPGSRRRSHLLACSGGPEGKEGPQGPGNRAGSVQRHHQTGRNRGDEEPAQDRPCPGRCLSRAPRARLPRRLHPLASAMAQAAGRPLGRPRAIRCAAPCLRTRAGYRKVHYAGILVTRRNAGDAAQRYLRCAPRWCRRQENPAS